MRTQEIVDNLAKVLKRPITLEDARGRLIAYSVHEEPVDSVRMETLLRKGASDATLNVLRDKGVYRFIDSSPGIARVTAIAEIGFSSRLCAAVRQEEKVLGYLWVLGGDRALSEGLGETLLNARSALAEALAKGEPVADPRQSEHDSVLASVLEGRDARGRTGEGSLASMQRHKGPHRVVVVKPKDRGDAALARLLPYLDGVCHENCRSYVSGIFGKMCVVLLSGQDAEHASDIASCMASDLAGRHLPAWVGLGGPCSRLADVRRSYAEASKAVALGVKMGLGGSLFDYRTLAPYEMFACLASCEKAPTYGRDAVEKVIAYDGLRSGTLFKTLETYLDYYGKRRQAAKELQVHPNTLDYRIRKVGEVTGLDLDDANTRLVVHVWVKALAPKVSR